MKRPARHAQATDAPEVEHCFGCGVRLRAGDPIPLCASCRDDRDGVDPYTPREPLDLAAAGVEANRDPGECPRIVCEGPCGRRCSCPPCACHVCTASTARARRKLPPRRPTVAAGRLFD